MESFWPSSNGFFGAVFLTYILHSTATLEVQIDTSHVVELVNDKFVGVTLDTTLIEEGWLHFNVKSTKLYNLANALSPCYLRVGGTSADLLIFDPNRTDITKKWNDVPAEEQFEKFDKPTKNFTLSGTDWGMLNKFSASVGWNLIFDLNVLLRSNDHWDTNNAHLLLNYTEFKGFNVSGFQLGNEPNAFPHVFDVTVSASQLARDFRTLQSMLHSTHHYKDSIIIGPDTTQVNKKSTTAYFREFLASGGGQVVNKASFHHYYVNGRTASVQDFVNSTILDSMKAEIVTALNLTRSLAPRSQLWLGETGSAYGGGAKGLSDAYVAGFMWMDKLGLCARFGVKAVLRSTFYKSSYGLLDQDTLDPNPDYWMTLLYKRLVGGKVFDVRVTAWSAGVRLYAHCTNTHSMYGYKAGSLTLYGMNLLSDNKTVSVPSFTGKVLHIYWLTSPSGLKSRQVHLNGKLLKMVDERIPDLYPLKISGNKINIPAKTFGFIVIPDADVSVCK